MPNSKFKLQPLIRTLGIRVRLGIAALIIVVLSGLISIALFYSNQTKNLLAATNQLHLKSVQHFQRLIETSSMGLGRALEGFGHDDNILLPFSLKQRAVLLEHFAPSFKRLQEQLNISHAYFINLDGTVILRAHQPQQFGDLLKRHTFLKAQETKQLSCGIEMGMNFFSLRCVTPVYLEDELIGYMEMAEEIDHIFNQLKVATDSDYGLLLTENFIQQNDTNVSGTHVGKFELLYSTNKELMYSILSNTKLSKIQPQNVSVFVKNNDTDYAVNATQFNDISGQSRGLLISVLDITVFYSNAKKELITNITTILLITLGSCLLFIVAIKRSFTQLELLLKQRTQQIEFLALHDDLTQLPNRAMFTKRVSQSIREGKRYNRRFSILFMDLDGFKMVNDTLGHEAGDLLLQEVAQRLKECVRETDFVARLGDDEFVALLPTNETETNESLQVDIVAERIIDSISSSYTILDRHVTVTISIGISAYPSDGENENDLLKLADAAMYQAKGAGKNNVKRYSPTLHRQSLERRALEAGLRHALERDEFELYYQAKLDSACNEVIGMEALIRWNHPDLGVIEPDQFIATAEDTGLINPIGRWVIKTACEQNMLWLAQGMSMRIIAVNVSPYQFNDASLLDYIVTTLSTTGMPAHFLMLEITERVIIDNALQAKTILTELKKRGVRVAIDDLGVGYSSFSTLEAFPVDTIKIDRSFIKGLPDNKSHKAIVEAFITLGQKLGLTVIAEGVETQQQLDFLRNITCSQLQGFYYNRPMPAAEFADYIQGNSYQKSAAS